METFATDAPGYGSLGVHVAVSTPVIIRSGRFIATSRKMAKLGGNSRCVAMADCVTDRGVTRRYQLHAFPLPAPQDINSVRGGAHRDRKTGR